METTEQTGPLARCTVVTIDAAKNRCYYRLHPKPWVDSSRGARQLYDAVCGLWSWTFSQAALHDPAWQYHRTPSGRTVCADEFLK